MKKQLTKEIRTLAAKLPKIEGVNHYRKLKNAFQKDDVIGIKKYIKKVNQIK